MTKAQIAKLKTILGKVEALQNETRDGSARDRLGLAKDELLRLLNQCEARRINSYV